MSNTDSQLTEIRDLLRPFVQDAGALDGLDPETRLNELGIDSARVIDVVLAFEDRFERKLSEEEESGLSSVQGLIDLLA